MRKIKTFNVEEDVYKRLLAMFKQYEVNASLSSFVNNCLEELLSSLQEIEQTSHEHPTFKVPMSFVISEMTESLSNKKFVKPIFTMADQDINTQEIYDHSLLSKWENAYEAQKLGISEAMYSYIKSGNYTLSQNKQYLIDEKSGKKHIAIDMGNGEFILAGIAEEQG